MHAILYFFMKSPKLEFYLQLHAFYLVADDIMDKSLTRRGQPCWYKQVDKISCHSCGAFNLAYVQRHLADTVIRRPYVV